MRNGSESEMDGNLMAELDDGRFIKFLHLIELWLANNQRIYDNCQWHHVQTLNYSAKNSNSCTWIQI